MLRESPAPTCQLDSSAVCMRLHHLTVQTVCLFPCSSQIERLQIAGIKKTNPKPLGKHLFNNNGAIAPPFIYKTLSPVLQEKMNGAFGYSTATAAKHL